MHIMMFWFNMKKSILVHYHMSGCNFYLRNENMHFVQYAMSFTGEPALDRSNSVLITLGAYNHGPPTLDGSHSDYQH